MWRRLLWAVAASLLVAAVVAVESYTWQPPKYEASIKILVGQKPKSRSGTPYPIPTATSGLQDLTLLVATQVRTISVARAVVLRLNLPKGSAGKVLKNISVEQSPSTMFVNVSYTDSDPKRAQLVANTIGQVVSQKFSGMRRGNKEITATVWQPAKLPETPVSPKPLRNGLIALVVSLTLSAALIAWRESSGR